MGASSQNQISAAQVSGSAERSEKMPWGRTPAMVKLIRDAGRVAQSDLPVLITGPTGSGKEMVALHIHRLGPRRDAAFVPVNCGAIPETLIESELFGHERGAFTGAIHATDGYLGTVQDGTLFLDEIGELPLPQQTRLLRVFDTRSFSPIGSAKQQVFNGRIVAATNRDLKSMVTANRFREDLYYRIGVLILDVPGLASRRADIPELVSYMARSRNHDLRFTPEALAALAAAEWPGNIRQLRNTIDRIAVLSDDNPVSEKTVHRFIACPGSSEADRLDRIVEEVMALNLDNRLYALQEAMIRGALKKYGGNKTAAGRLLGVHRKVIERKLFSCAGHRASGITPRGRGQR